MSAGDDLTNLLSTEGTMLLPGVWDGLSARAATAAGHPALFLSGFALSATLLGRPDSGVLTEADAVGTIERILATCPGTVLVADADTGFGDPGGTAAAYEAAGAAALTIEDQAWPKVVMASGAPPTIVPRQDWLDRVEAALAARQSLWVIARTDARRADDLEEAIERGALAAEAGADAVFVEGLSGLDELRLVGRELAGVALVTAVVENGRLPQLTLTQWAETGFDLVLVPARALLGAYAGLRDVYADLGQAGAPFEDASLAEVADAVSDS